MNVWQVSIGLAAAIMLVVTWRLRHRESMRNAPLYIAIAAVIAVACDVAYGLKPPYGVMFAFAADGFFCLYLDWKARGKWERAFNFIYIVSLGISSARLFYELAQSERFGLFLVADMNDYRLYQELCNWAALLLVGGVLTMDLARDVFSRHPWLTGLRRAHDYLVAPRSRPYWYEN